MMDISLFYHLLCALKEGARLILVGDIDQLPPVGPGSPLKDLIEWGEVPVVRLEHISVRKKEAVLLTTLPASGKGNSAILMNKVNFPFTMPLRKWMRSAR